MANLKFIFKGKNYSIDETAVAPASTELKSHLSEDMSGSGAVINLDGSSYNIDSEKLTTSRNDFVSHLGTISGTGSTIVVNGVGYSVDSTKLDTATTELTTTFGRLSSGGEPVVMRAAGLYETGTDNLVAPWEQLVADGVFRVIDGAIIVGSKLPEDFPEKNEYGFYYGVPYSGLDGTYTFYEDGSFDVSYDDGETSNYPADSATYSSNNIYISDWGWSLNVVNDGNTLDGGEGLYEHDQKHSIVGDLVLPNDYTITVVPYGAFDSQSSLTGVILPDSIKYIGDSAFYYCESLTTITIPNIISYIGYNAFYGCSSLQDVYYKGTEAEWSTISIDSTNEPLNNAALYYEGSPVPTIGAAGLYATGSNYKVLKTSWEDLVADGSIIVNDGVLSGVGTAVPKDLPEKNEYGFYYGVPYSGLDGTYTFYEDGSLDDYHDGKTHSNPAGFATYSSNNIYISGWSWSLNVVNDGNTLDDGLGGLYELGQKYLIFGDLVLPNDNSITVISDSAFAMQYSLTGITIPNSVTSIGDYAFGDGYNLVKLNYMGTIDQWAEIEFVGHGSNPLTFGSRFYVDKNLVTTVNLTSASKLSDNAFERCMSLTEVTVGGSVTSIGSGAFSYCTGLSSVVISDGVTSINSSAFEYCENLNSITIPSSVTYIGYQAFIECTNLQNIYYTGTETQWSAITISSGNKSLTNATIHYNYQG